eukprot:gene10661-7407_t
MVIMKSSHPTIGVAYSFYKWKIEKMMGVSNVQMAFDSQYQSILKVILVLGSVHLSLSLSVVFILRRRQQCYTSRIKDVTGFLGRLAVAYATEPRPSGEGVQDQFSKEDQCTFVAIFSNHLHTTLFIPAGALKLEEARRMYACACLGGAAPPVIVDTWNILSAVLQLEAQDQVVSNSGEAAALIATLNTLQGRLAVNRFICKKDLNQLTVAPVRDALAFLQYASCATHAFLNTGFLLLQLVLSRVVNHNFSCSQQFETSLLAYVVGQCSHQGVRCCLYQTFQQLAAENFVAGAIRDGLQLALSGASQQWNLGCRDADRISAYRAAMSLASQDFIPNEYLSLRNRVIENIYSCHAFAVVTPLNILIYSIDILEDLTTLLAYPVQCLVAWWIERYIRHLENLLCLVDSLVQYKAANEVPDRHSQGKGTSPQPEPEPVECVGHVGLSVLVCSCTNSTRALALQNLMLHARFPSYSCSTVRVLSLPLCDLMERTFKHNLYIQRWISNLRKNLLIEVGPETETLLDFSSLSWDNAADSNYLMLLKRNGTPFKLQLSGCDSNHLDLQAPIRRLLGRAGEVPLSMALAVSDCMGDSLSPGSPHVHRISLFARRFMQLRKANQPLRMELENLVFHLDNGTYRGFSFFHEVQFLQRLCSCAPLIDKTLWGQEDPFSSGPWSVEFRKVSFAYPGSKKLVLRDVSFRVEAGQCVGLVGFSGAGKSTILLLINRIYAPTSGAILVNDAPIEDLPVRGYRRRVGYAWQDNSSARFLDGADIATNVALGDVNSASMQRVRRSLEVAGAREFVHSRYGGCGSVLFTNRFSGGEIERLSIARAAMTATAHPTILLMDEAMSAVDSVTEEKIWVSLEQMFTSQGAHPTLINVTHRLSSLKKFDLIIVISNGSVAQQGSWEELVLAPDASPFRTLLEAQKVECELSTHAEGSFSGWRSLIEGTADVFPTTDPPGFKGRCSPLPEDKIISVGVCETTKVPLVICYNTFGDESNPCVLLVNGLGSPVLVWDDSFCEMIADKGYYVVRYDNRDVGLSTHLDHDQFPPPAVIRFIIPRCISFGEGEPWYSLYDMAKDGMKLLSALGIEKAHVVGASMGGMIVQCMAILFPDRVRSLNIIYSHSSGPNVKSQTVKASLSFLDGPKSDSFQDIVDFKVRHRKLFVGEYPVPEEQMRRDAERSLRRCDVDAEGTKRQVWAIQRARSRENELKSLTCPTLVIHGKKDIMIPCVNGEALAKIIPNAQLVLYEKMGHALPVQLFEDIIDNYFYPIFSCSISSLTSKKSVFFIQVSIGIMVGPGFKGRCSPLPEDQFVEVGVCDATQVPLVLCYNTFGDKSNPCVLLVSGYTSTLLGWWREFCQMIADKGYYVIRFDNRDVGLSTHLDQFPPPQLQPLADPSKFNGKAIYSLDDMAKDGMKLLTKLGIEKAHIIGQSMGGMIVQCMAILFPERVLSLTIFYSHCGGESVVPTPQAVAFFMAKPKSDSLEDRLEFEMHRRRLLWGKYSITDDQVLQHEREKMKRCDPDPDGCARQMLAIITAPGREAKLKTLKIPTLVIHGKQDILISHPNGEKLAQMIPNAELAMYEDMGHSIPHQLYEELVGKILMFDTQFWRYGFLSLFLLFIVVLWFQCIVMLYSSHEKCFIGAFLTYISCLFEQCKCFLILVYCCCFSLVVVLFCVLITLLNLSSRSALASKEGALRYQRTSSLRWESATQLRSHWSYNLAHLIPNAEFVAYEGMGHAIPDQLCTELVEKTMENIRKGGFIFYRFKYTSFQLCPLVCETPFNFSISWIVVWEDGVYPMTSAALRLIIAGTTAVREAIADIAVQIQPRRAERTASFFIWPRGIDFTRVSFVENQMGWKEFLSLAAAKQLLPKIRAYVLVLDALIIFSHPQLNSFKLSTVVTIHLKKKRLVFGTKACVSRWVSHSRVLQEEVFQELIRFLVAILIPMPPFVKNAHRSNVDEVLKELKVDAGVGLSSDQVAERLHIGTENPFWQLVLDQFGDMMVRILLVAAFISYGVSVMEGDYYDFVEPGIILLILILNAIVGVFQENRAEEAIDALKTYTATTAVVLRDGRLLNVDAEDLVPGDVAEMSVGTRVPADIRIIDIHSTTFRTDQSILSGESEEVMKITDAVQGDQRFPMNMVFSGTSVVYGRARGVVIHTGRETEIGSIQRHVQDQDDVKTPLQLKLDEFGVLLSKVIGYICLLVFAVNMLHWYRHFDNTLEIPIYEKYGEPVVHSLKVAVALAVAAIPEGLPAVVTTCLALGTRRLSRRNALIRDLGSVETLGRCTVICSDKTGTLTTNMMSVMEICTLSADGTVKSYHLQDTKLDVIGGTLMSPDGAVLPQPFDDAALHQLSMVSVLCNEAALKYNSEKNMTEKVGEATEAALLVMSEKLALGSKTGDIKNTCAFRDSVEKKWKTKATLEFTRCRKSMSVRCSSVEDQKDALFVKGAPEELLQRSTHVLLGDGAIVELTESLRDKLDKRIDALSAELALRAIGFAFKPLGAEEDLDLTNPSNFVEVESNMIFVGACGMIDPPREDVPDAIRKCQSAGIRVVVITGDKRETAVAICQKVGLLGSKIKHGEVLSGTEFDAMLPEQKKEAAKTAVLFCRADPSHKMQLQFIRYLISSNIGEVACVLTTGVLGLPEALTPIQLLWVNLVTDGLPATALSFNKPDDDIMEQPPRSVDEPIVNSWLFIRYVVVGAYVGLSTVFSFLWWFSANGYSYLDLKNASGCVDDSGVCGVLGNPKTARAIALSNLVVVEMFNALNALSENSSILVTRPSSNVWLIFTIASSIFLHLIIMYVPFFADLFSITPLGVAPAVLEAAPAWSVLIPTDFTEWRFILLCSFPVILIDELLKLITRMFSHAKNDKPSDFSQRCWNGVESGAMLKLKKYHHLFSPFVLLMHVAILFTKDCSFLLDDYLPEIRKKNSVPSESMAQPSSFTSRFVLDELSSICDDISTSSSVKRRLKSVMARLQEESHSMGSFASTHSPRHHGSRLQAAFNEVLNGECLMRQRTYQGSNTKARMMMDIAAPPHSNSTTGSPRVFKRTNPATQPPGETFSEMNEIMMYSLCLVNVAEIEFDIHNCFSNFAFVKFLDLNKLMKYLSSIYNLYTASNPYRNYLHAADSLQMLSLFFRDPAVNFLFTDEEILLCFLSVLALDVSHIGLHNNSLAAIEHNLVKVFGPSQTTEHAAALVFLHELFHEGNFFLAPLYKDSSAKVTSIVRESITATVLGTANCRRAFLLYELERIGASGAVRHCDIPQLMIALVILASNGFVFRQRAQCFRFGHAFRSELLREANEMAQRKLDFFIPMDCLENVSTLIADYCAAVVKSVVDSIRALVPVDLHDNFIRNCEVPPSEEAEALSQQAGVSPYSPWVDDSEDVTEILLNYSTFAHSMNREVSKMAILNASPPRNFSVFESHRPCSPVEARSESDAGGLDDSQNSFGESHYCKTEHCFLFLQLYNNYEMEGKTLEEFLGQLVFLAMQLDPYYLSLEARNLFIKPDSADYVGLGKYIMENEEAPPTAERLVNRNGVQTPGCKTDGFLLQLMEMYDRRSNKEVYIPIVEDPRPLPEAADSIGGEMSPAAYPPCVTLPGTDTPTRRSVGYGSQPSFIRNFHSVRTRLVVQASMSRHNTRRLKAQRHIVMISLNSYFAEAARIYIYIHISVISDESPLLLSCMGSMSESIGCGGTLGPPLSVSRFLMGLHFSFLSTVSPTAPLPLYSSSFVFIIIIYIYNNNSDYAALLFNSLAMGPRIAGFLSGALMVSVVGACFMKEKQRKRMEFTNEHLAAYENDVQALQQRMLVVERGFALLQRVQKVDNSKLEDRYRLRSLFLRLLITIGDVDGGGADMNAASFVASLLLLVLLLFRSLFAFFCWCCCCFVSKLKPQSHSDLAAMAQWIPKTAWKVSNLNKRYGQQYLLGGSRASLDEDNHLVSYATALHQKMAREKVAEVLSSSMHHRGNPLPGSCLIDVRDDSERRSFPLPPQSAVPIHPHDLLSGAAAPLLPWNKDECELFVISASPQRAVNSLAALRRWGYSRASVLDYESAKKFLDCLSLSLVSKRSKGVLHTNCSESKWANYSSLYSFLIFIFFVCVLLLSLMLVRYCIMSTNNSAPRRQKPQVNLLNINSVEPAVTKDGVNTPKSLAICARFSVNPKDLAVKTKEDFMGPKVSAELAAMRHRTYMKKQKQLVEKLAPIRESQKGKSADGQNKDGEAAPATKSSRSPNRSPNRSPSRSPSRGGSPRRTTDVDEHISKARERYSTMIETQETIHLDQLLQKEVQDLFTLQKCREKMEQERLLHYKKRRAREIAAANRRASFEAQPETSPMRKSLGRTTSTMSVQTSLGTVDTRYKVGVKKCLNSSKEKNAHVCVKSTSAANYNVISTAGRTDGEAGPGVALQNTRIFFFGSSILNLLFKAIELRTQLSAVCAHLYESAVKSRMARKQREMVIHFRDVFPRDTKSEKVQDNTIGSVPPSGAPPKKIPMKMPAPFLAGKVPIAAPPGEPAAPRQRAEPPRPTKRQREESSSDSDSDSDSSSGSSGSYSSSRSSSSSSSRSSRSSSSESSEESVMEPQEPTLFDIAKKEGLIKEEALFEDEEPAVVNIQPPRPPRFNSFPSDLDRAIERQREKLNREENAIKMKDDNKAVSLGTSKVNYIDPRIICSWAKEQDVPIKKIFSATLQKKFPWAMNASDFEF